MEVKWQKIYYITRAYWKWLGATKNIGDAAK